MRFFSLIFLFTFLITGQVSANLAKNSKEFSMLNGPISYPVMVYFQGPIAEAIYNLPSSQNFNTRFNGKNPFVCEELDSQVTCSVGSSWVNVFNYGSESFPKGVPFEKTTMENIFIDDLHQSRTSTFGANTYGISIKDAAAEFLMYSPLFQLDENRDTKWPSAINGQETRTWSHTVYENKSLKCMATMLRDQENLVTAGMLVQHNCSFPASNIKVIAPFKK